MYINTYNLCFTGYDVLLVRRLHLVSPALLPSGRGFKPHLLHRFLTFHADLTKWPDGLMGRPGTVDRSTCRAWARAVARGRRAHAGPSFGHLYAEVCFGMCMLVAWSRDVGCAERTDVQRVNLK
jgi:hypothetical protein